MDDFSDDINTTGVLMADGTVTTGSLEIANDMDWFALEVTQGELYQIELSSNLRFADIELYCPSSYKMARISVRAKRDFAHLFGWY